MSEMELGATIEGMVPRSGALDVFIYIISIIGAAVLFFFKP